ncbi:tyrosine--tRNA ligase [bacterium G20]|nr:tyrosine--tRNA ligase [bacterium G20]
MPLSDDLAWRGLIKDKTFADNTWLDEPRKFYLGIDASSDSLTIGNLAVVMLARRFSEAGWKTVLLAGGATSLVGDPGGKVEERDLQSREQIAKNIVAIKDQIEKLFAGQSYEMVNNLDWLGDLTYLNFLRNVGKHFSMTELMQRDFVRERMGAEGSGISYAEFSYSLLQGYDFLWLFKNRGVELQIGASDQWGNMLSGVPLIRKKEDATVHALSMPLVVNKATGVKFGKSETGAVWLDPNKTSPTQFYQFWINVDDADVEDYFKIFTLLSREEVEDRMQRHQSSPEERYAQSALAELVTTIVHGPEKSGVAGTVTNVLTGKTDVDQVGPAVIETIRREIPAVTVPQNANLIEVLVSTGLATSNSDARRLLASGAVYINGSPTDKENFDDNDFKNGRLLLRRGKAYKDSALVELE